MKAIPVVLALFWTLPAAAAPAKLPGAQAVVDAAGFPSLQAAIDAVPVTGGMLRLPPGEFKISGPLRIRHQDLRIEGAGTATWIHNENTAGQPSLVIAADPAEPRSNQRGYLWRVMLSNFRLTGNEKSGHGIEAGRVNELFLQGMTISRHGGDGIHCTQCYEDMRLNDCLVTYNKGAGLFARGNHDTIVSACQFEENFDGVVFVEGFNLTLTGNNIDDHLRHGVVVTGNSILRVKQFGVRVSAESGRTTIVGNAFSDSSVGRGVIRAKGNRIPGSDLNDAAGIRLEAASDVAITGNTFAGLVTPPLTRVGDCPGVVFENNVVTESPRAPVGR